MACQRFLIFQARIAFSSIVLIVRSPPDVHVRRERMVCKVWLTPVVLSLNHGFSPRELNRIRGIILDNLERILEAWHDHCGE
jgi:Domain of unknown function (DUF4160)